MMDDNNQNASHKARRSNERRASSFVGNNRHFVLTRFGAAVRQRRQELDWTQEDLARRAGISRSSISEIESGKENVSLERAERIAQELACDLSLLLADSNV